MSRCLKEMGQCKSNVSAQIIFLVRITITCLRYNFSINSEENINNKSIAENDFRFVRQLNKEKSKLM